MYKINVATAESFVCELAWAWVIRLGDSSRGPGRDGPVSLRLAGGDRPPVTAQGQSVLLKGSQDARMD